MLLLLLLLSSFFFDLAQDGYGREHLSFLFPHLRKQKIRKIWPRYLPESILRGVFQGYVGETLDSYD